MNKKYNFETILIYGPFKGIYAEFPFDSRKEFGTKRHVWCEVSFDGQSAFMNLLPNGKGGHWLHVKKEILDVIGKQEGDSVKIELQKSSQPRTVLIPEYLQWLLENDTEMGGYFQKLPISAKKFWIQHIEVSKNGDTKVARINKLFELLQKQNTR